MKNFKSINRRHFIESTAIAAVAASSTAIAQPAETTNPETIVGELFASLKPKQKNQICFDWNHQDPKRGLLRTFVANNWNITNAEINSDFYTDSQRAMVQKWTTAGEGSTSVALAGGVLVKLLHGGHDDVHEHQRQSA